MLGLVSFCVCAGGAVSFLMAPPGTAKRRKALFLFVFFLFFVVSFVFLFVGFCFFLFVLFLFLLFIFCFRVFICSFLRNGAFGAGGAVS